MPELRGVVDGGGLSGGWLTGVGCEDGLGGWINRSCSKCLDGGYC